VQKITMKMSFKNPNQCLHCGKRLSVFHLLRNLLYCNSSHISAHMRELNGLALARLVATGKFPPEIRSEQGERRMRQEEVVSTL